jgi:cytochrome c553
MTGSSLCLMSMRSQFFLFRSATASALLFCAAACMAADDTGRIKAQQACAVCHGVAGVSSAPDAPHLAGQPEAYLVAQLRAFRSVSRRHEVMNVVAKSLTDDEIAALSRWYASIRIEAQPAR